MIEDADTNGKPVRRPAANGTKHNVLVALRAIWRHNFPDEPVPFANVAIRDVADHTSDDHEEDLVFDVYDTLTLQAQIRKEEGKGGLTPLEIVRAFVGAMHRDRELASHPNLSAIGFVPIAVFVMAILIATGCRISEALRIRWCDINFDKGFILVRQSKRQAKARRKRKPMWRVVPLQDSLRPWLEELAKLLGITDTKARSYLIVSRVDRQDQRASRNGIINRCIRTLLYAGCKPDRYATHWGRATHATIAMHAPGVKKEEYLHFLGHVAFEGSTQEYIATVLAMLRPEHRGYVQLPTPDEVRAQLCDFKPVPRNWRESRTVQPRTNEARAERERQRATRTPLGTRVTGGA